MLVIRSLTTASSSTSVRRPESGRHAAVPDQQRDAASTAPAVEFRARCTDPHPPQREGVATKPCTRHPQTTRAPGGTGGGDGAPAATTASGVTVMRAASRTGQLPPRLPAPRGRRPAAEAADPPPRQSRLRRESLHLQTRCGT